MSSLASRAARPLLEALLATDPESRTERALKRAFPDIHPMQVMTGLRYLKRRGLACKQIMLADPHRSDLGNAWELTKSGRVLAETRIANRVDYEVRTFRESEP